MKVEWKRLDELNKTGIILTICRDNTGIYNQLMFVLIEGNGDKKFFENGTLGCSHRVYPDKIKAAIYLDEICPDDVVEKFCNEECDAHENQA